MKVMAFDASSKATGWAYGSAGRVEAFGTIRPRKKKNEVGDGSWLLQTYEEARALIDQHQPDIAVIEEPFFPVGTNQFNPEVIVALNKAYGAVEMAIANFDTVLKPPVSVLVWRKFFLRLAIMPQKPFELEAALRHYNLWPADADGKDRQDVLKRATMRRCMQLGHNPMNDNEGDATGLCYYQMETVRKAPQIEEQIGMKL